MAVIPAAPPPSVVAPAATVSDQSAERHNAEVQSERPTEGSFQSSDQRNQDVVVIENPQGEQAAAANDDADRARASSPDGQGLQVDIRI